MSVFTCCMLWYQVYMQYAMIIRKTRISINKHVLVETDVLTSHPWPSFIFLCVYSCATITHHMYTWCESRVFPSNFFLFVCDCCSRSLLSCSLSVLWDGRRYWRLTLTLRLWWPWETPTLGGTAWSAPSPTRTRLTLAWVSLKRNQPTSQPTN